VDDASKAIRVLRRRGIPMAPGLSDDEVRAVERRWRFAFPPDLRALLALAVPIGPEFPNWRQPSDPSIVRRMAWPAEGVLFDVEHDAFWLEGSWGPRPPALPEALERAGAVLAGAPPLIPVYGHRYLPSVPCEAGNPVLSVWQADLIVYGVDLADYVKNEFARWRFRRSHRPRAVPFWSDLLDLGW